MRALLIFLFFLVSLVSAESEVLTLNDGRVLTGVYDEDKNLLTVVSGKVTAIITVKVGDIKSRKLLNPPPPERDFIAEASRFDEQQKSAEEQREKRREAERMATEAEADQLSAKMRESAIKRAEEAAALQSSPVALQSSPAALQSSPAALEDARFREEDRREIARRQAEADESRGRMVRNTEPEVAKLSQEALERENDEKKRVDLILKFKREQELAGIAADERQAFRAKVLLVVSLFVLLTWSFPALLSHYRRFDKRWEVTILLMFTLIAGFGVLMVIAVINESKADYGGPGIGITAIGWLGALTWVLIASKPRIKKE